MTDAIKPQPDAGPYNGERGEIVPNCLPGALNRFYRAFNGRDLALLQSCWFDLPETAMSNPAGGLARGWASVSAIYGRILGGELRVWVELFDCTVVESGDLAVVVGRERGFARLAEKEIELSIRTSRVFMRRGGEWRQIHHHGSITDPRLLESYLAMINAGVGASR